MSVGEWIALISFGFGVLGGIFKIIKSLDNTLDEFKYMVKTSEKDRENLHKKDDAQDIILGDHQKSLNEHDKKIAILENFREQVRKETKEER